ncbi:MAG: hypothetical protein PHS23_09710 [Candidatus Cloacimonetes bacterium]|nr:hypothetical protein [Candidatus Cloacimonadota bacterium]
MSTKFIPASVGAAESSATIAVGAAESSATIAHWLWSRCGHNTVTFVTTL